MHHTKLSRVHTVLVLALWMRGARFPTRKRCQLFFLACRMAGNHHNFFMVVGGGIVSLVQILRVGCVRKRLFSLSLLSLIYDKKNDSNRLHLLKQGASLSHTWMPYPVSISTFQNQDSCLKLLMWGSIYPVCQFSFFLYGGFLLLLSPALLFLLRIGEENISFAAFPFTCNFFMSTLCETYVCTTMGDLTGVCWEAPSHVLPVEQRKFLVVLTWDHLFFNFVTRYVRKKKTIHSPRKGLGRLIGLDQFACVDRHFVVAVRR